jgi:hypothetical protein
MPANTPFLSLGISLMVGLYHLFDHLSFSKRLRNGL